MSRLHTYVLSYDIADDARRVRLAHWMEARGTRVQRSVFELLSTRAGVVELLRQATAPERFDFGADSVRCYPLCTACLKTVDVRGTAALPLSVDRPLVL